MTNKIINYLKKNRFRKLDLQAVLFDMDGVIYNSMPGHQLSWDKTIQEWGLKAIPNESFLEEGKPARLMINALFQRSLKRDATAQEAEDFYKRKTELFFEYDSGGLIPGIKETMEIIQNKKLNPILVTGSSQPDLYARLNSDLPNIFKPETMITAHDVKIGKPNPEPYLMGLKKAGNLTPNQAIVIENAPLGVASAHNAAIFTVAVNTGPLENKVLIDAGADLLMESLKEFNYKLPELLNNAKSVEI